MWCDCDAVIQLKGWIEDEELLLLLLLRTSFIDRFAVQTLNAEHTHTCNQLTTSFPSLFYLFIYLLILLLFFLAIKLTPALFSSCLSLSIESTWRLFTVVVLNKWFGLDEWLFGFWFYLMLVLLFSAWNMYRAVQGTMQIYLEFNFDIVVKFFL